MPPRSPPTHFLCIPLAGSQLAASLASFRADVTSLSTFGVPPEAVRPPGTLHLTLGVMSLQKDGIAKATELLQSLKLKTLLADAQNSTRQGAMARSRLGLRSEASRGDTQGPSTAASAGLSISIQGLHSMQPASAAAVLYAPPLDPEGILYDFCNKLRHPFLESGLMADEDRPLLLHATIVNTIYVKRSRGDGPRGRRKERLTLDARDILRKYDDYPWATGLPITKVAICRMGAVKIEGTNDEAYEVEADVEF